VINEFGSTNKRRLLSPGSCISMSLLFRKM
jgi:hypothetical protein